MSEACGRRRLAKLVFATGASGNLRGFLEEGVHASYNYRLTDPFVFHVAFLEEHLRSDSDSKSDSFKAAAKEDWSEYKKAQYKSLGTMHYSEPEDALNPYHAHASTLHVAPEFLWALANPRQAKTASKLADSDEGKDLKQRWDTLQLEDKHLKSIESVSDEAQKAAKLLKAWQIASEEQKKAAEELIEVARNGAPDQEQELIEAAETAYRAWPQDGWEGDPLFESNYAKLKRSYHESKVEWAIVTAKISPDLLKCTAAKKALLKRNTLEAAEAFKKLSSDDTSLEHWDKKAKETTENADAAEGCWKTTEAEQKLSEFKKTMRKNVEDAKSASQRAIEAEKSAKNASQTAEKAAQSAQSMKKPNASDISRIQLDSERESTPISPLVTSTEKRLNGSPQTVATTPRSDLEQGKPISENTTASGSPASKSSTFPCGRTITIVGILLIGYAVWKAIRPVPSQNLMPKSAVKNNKVKSRAASMAEATGMSKTNHEEGGLCSQLV